MEERNTSGVPVEDVDKLAAAVDGVRAVAPAVSGQIVLICQRRRRRCSDRRRAEYRAVTYLPPGQAIAEPDTFVEGSPPTQTGQVALNTQRRRASRN